MTDTTQSGQPGSGDYPFAIVHVSNIVGATITIDLMFDGWDSTLDTTGIPLNGGAFLCGQGYQGGGGWKSGLWDTITVYDPDDLVKVYNGTLGADAVPQKSSAQLVVPSRTFPTPGFAINIGIANDTQVRGGL